MGYDEFDVFMINCKDVKVYIPANFKMNNVKKNSKLAKKLDKNGDKYNVY